MVQPLSFGHFGSNGKLPLKVSEHVAGMGRSISPQYLLFGYPAVAVTADTGLFLPVVYYYKPMMNLYADILLWAFFRC